VVTRSGLSEHEFNEEFGSLEECFCATLEQGLSLMGRALVDAIRDEKRWLMRVRIALVTMLAFLDSQPDWARLLVIETPTAGAKALKRRDEALARLAELLERGSPGVEAGAELTLQRGLVAELVVGGVLAVVHSRMVKHSGMPLADLAPSLIAMTVLPYLGREAANVELEQHFAGASGVALRRPAKLPTRTTYRTALVLRAIAGTPNASNREVAAAAGVIDEGQTSRLLARLQRQGLIENVGLGHAYGEPNAWLLTATGRQVAELSLTELAPRPQKMSAPSHSGRPECQGGTR
jgi:IclR helix-turn-helix domain